MDIVEGLCVGRESCRVGLRGRPHGQADRGPEWRGPSGEDVPADIDGRKNGDAEQVLMSAPIRRIRAGLYGI